MRREVVLILALAVWSYPVVPFAEAADGSSAPDNALPTFEVHRCREVPPRVDGAIDDAAWQSASRLEQLQFPWRAMEPPATVFRALADCERFYFAFEASDTSVVVRESVESENQLDQEDRVELFLACDVRLSNYYCVEIDPIGRVHDYQASYYRKFDSEWNCESLKVAAQRIDGGYIVEGSIQLEELQGLGVVKRHDVKAMIVGVYRAEFTAEADGSVDQAWISWVNPKTDKPDLHVPGSFGHLRIAPLSAEPSTSSRTP